MKAYKPQEHTKSASAVNPIGFSETCFVWEEKQWLSNQVVDVELGWL